jgi:hypothetical protein
MTKHEQERFQGIRRRLQLEGRLRGLGHGQRTKHLAVDAVRQPMGPHTIGTETGLQFGDLPPGDIAHPPKSQRAKRVDQFTREREHRQRERRQELTACAGRHDPDPGSLPDECCRVRRDRGVRYADANGGKTRLLRCLPEGLRQRRLSASPIPSPGIDTAPPGIDDCHPRRTRQQRDG